MSNCKMNDFLHRPMHTTNKPNAGDTTRSEQPIPDSNNNTAVLNESCQIDFDTLPVLPEIYTSLRNVLVVRHLSVGTIATRISNFMRLNDIHCQNGSHPGRVTCCTDRVPKFHLQLWERRRDGPKNEILVELQRRRGCSIAMQKIRSAMFRAILSGDHTAHRWQRKIPPVPLTIKRMDEKRRVRKREMDLDLCVNLLESPRRDQKQLGFESLSILTNPNRVHPDDAYAIATTLVCRRGKYGGALQNEIEDFLHMVQEERSDDEYNDAKDCALQAIANSLELVLQRREDRANEPILELRNSSGLLATFWANVSHILARIVTRHTGCLQHHVVTAAKIIHDMEYIMSGNASSGRDRRETAAAVGEGGACLARAVFLRRVVSLDEESRNLLLSPGKKGQPAAWSA